MSRIDEALQRREEVRRVRPPNMLYATDLTKPCLRELWLSIFQDRPHKPETLRIFDAGRMIEDRWVEVYLEEARDVTVLGTQLPAWVKFAVDGVEWDIHGRVDALCQHSNGALVVHEVKSAKTVWQDRAKPEHVAQLQYYMSVLGVERGQVDYLDKTAWLTGDRPVDRSFPVKLDPNAYYKMMDLARHVAGYIQRKEMPAGNPKAWGGRICSYCLYNDVCEEEECSTK